MMQLRMKVLVATILLITCSMMAMADNVNIEVGGVNYSLDESSMTASVEYSEKASGDIVLPESVTYNNKAYAVTSIGKEAFYDRSDITSIKLPSSVKTIGDYAFEQCSNLVAVNIPYGVKAIGESTFSCCIMLKSIEIPSSVTSIGKYAFSASGLTSVEIPGSVVSIGQSAFYCCYQLSSLKLNDGLKSIGNDAFHGCEILESISIPSTVESIGKRVISSCKALKSVKVEEGNKVYDSRNNSNAIIETATNALISGCYTTLIPYGIERIEEEAFRVCEKITSIDIPSSVTYIGEEAFSLCKSLTTVSIPASVTSISGNPFINCDNLKTIVVDKANKAFDSRNNCNAIIETATNTLITACNSTLIPYGVTAIGARAFSETELSKIDLPATVTTIEKNAFAFCHNLTSVKIPDGVTLVEEYAFYYCPYLKDVYFYGTEEKDYYESSFAGIAEDAVLHVDASLVDLYKADEYLLSIFTDIVPLTATGIENIHADDNNETYQIYSVDGKQQDAMQKGINILRYKNGKTIKVIRK